VEGPSARPRTRRRTSLTAPAQDEAYELGTHWANLYEPGSPSRTLLTELMETSLLVNVVHNDFKDADAIFRPFLAAGEEYAAKQAQAHVNGGLNGAATNGHVNGTATNGHTSCAAAHGPVDVAAVKGELAYGH
jgi:hypothetical protein